MNIFVSPNRLYPLRFIGPFAIAVAVAQSALATSASWLGTTSGTWATNTNWTGAPATVPGNGDTATFFGAGNGNTTISTGSINLGNLIFDTSSAAAYTIGGATVGTGQISLSPGGKIQVNSTVTNSQLVNTVVIVSSSTTATNSIQNDSTSATLTLAGNIRPSSVSAIDRPLIVTGAGNTVLSGTLTNSQGAPSTSLSLVKNGTGTLTLTNKSTYSGSTTINAGTLVLSSTGSIVNSTAINLASTSAVFDVHAVSFTLQNNQTLEGIGTVTGNVTTGSGSILNPGAGAGTLHINGDLALGGHEVYDFDSGDLITVANLALGTAMTVSSANLGNGTYNLFSYTGLLSGTSNLSSWTAPSVTSSYSFGFDSTSKMVYLNVVPEPATWALLGVGAGTFLIFRRRAL